MRDSTAKPGDRGSLGAIFLVVFLDLVGFSIIFPLFPSMLEWYLSREGDGSLIGHLVALIEASSPGEVPDPFLTTVLFGGVLGSLYSVLQFVFAPIWGRLSDHFGRRRILLLTVGGAALSYLVWLFSRDFVVLLVARTIGGIMAGNIAVATAAVADVTSRENRSKGMALIGLAFGLGFIVGPAIGGMTSMWNPVETWPASAAWGLHPFSLPAFCALILSVVNGIWVALRLKETRDLSEPCAVPPERRGWLVFLRVDNRNVSHAILVYFVLLVAFSAMEFTLTFLAVERLHYNPRQLTLVFLFVGVVLALTQGWFVRRYARRLGETHCVMGGLMAGSIGLALLGIANAPLAFYSGLTFLGVGIGITSPTLSSLVSLYAGAATQGKNLGAFRSAGALARALGPLIGASIFWASGSLIAYFTGAMGLIIALLLSLTLPPPAVSAEN